MVPCKKRQQKNIVWLADTMNTATEQTAATAIANVATITSARTIPNTR